MTSSLLPGFPVPSRPCRSVRSGLRAADGSVNIIPFSVVTTINNTSRGIGNATISITIPYDEDIDRVDVTLKEIVAEMRKAFQIDLPVRALFDSPTVAKLAIDVKQLILTKIEALSEDEAERLLRMTEGFNDDLGAECDQLLPASVE